jgi:AhpD family alkylhydroperoxidase
MHSRINSPAMIFPGLVETLQTLSKTTDKSGLPQKVREMAHLRASQINGCSVCVDMHWRNLKRSNETDERVFPWRPGGMRLILPMLSVLRWR